MAETVLTKVESGVEAGFAAVVGGVKDLASFVESAVKNGTSSTELTNVANNLKAAAAAGEAALPQVAVDLVNSALALIPGGSNYDAIADAFLTQVITAAEAKLSGTKAS